MLRNEKFITDALDLIPNVSLDYKTLKELTSSQFRGIISDSQTLVIDGITINETGLLRDLYYEKTWECFSELMKLSRSFVVTNIKNDSTQLTLLELPFVDLIPDYDEVKEESNHLLLSIQLFVDFLLKIYGDSNDIFQVVTNNNLTRNTVGDISAFRDTMILNARNMEKQDLLCYIAEITKYISLIHPYINIDCDQLSQNLAGFDEVQLRHIIGLFARIPETPGSTNKQDLINVFGNLAEILKAMSDKDTGTEVIYRVIIASEEGAAACHSRPRIMFLQLLLGISKQVPTPLSTYKEAFAVIVNEVIATYANSKDRGALRIANIDELLPQELLLEQAKNNNLVKLICIIPKPFGLLAADNTLDEKTVEDYLEGIKKSEYKNYKTLFLAKVSNPNEKVLDNNPNLKKFLELGNNSVSFDALPEGHQFLFAFIFKYFNQEINREMNNDTYIDFRNWINDSLTDEHQRLQFFMRFFDQIFTNANDHNQFGQANGSMDIFNVLMGELFAPKGYSHEASTAASHGYQAELSKEIDNITALNVVSGITLEQFAKLTQYNPRIAAIYHEKSKIIDEKFGKHLENLLKYYEVGEGPEKQDLQNKIYNFQADLLRNNLEEQKFMLAYEEFVLKDYHGGGRKLVLSPGTTMRRVTAINENITNLTKELEKLLEQYKNNQAICNYNYQCKLAQDQKETEINKLKADLLLGGGIYTNSSHIEEQETK